MVISHSMGRIVAYRFHLLPDSKIHPVFHVSSLKKHVGAAASPSPTLPPFDPNGFLHWKPEHILDMGMFKKKNTAVTKWLSNGQVCRQKMQPGRKPTTLLLVILSFRPEDESHLKRPGGEGEGGGVVRTISLGLLAIDPSLHLLASN